jgi:signal transduction histidine kinase
MGSIFFVILRGFFSDSEEITIMNESLLQIQRIIDKTDANLISDNTQAQNNLMNQVSAKGFHICAMQNGKALFTNMDDEEQAFLSEHITQENLYTVNQTLWVPDDDFNLLWRKVDTNTFPIVFIVLGFNDAENHEEAGRVITFISISILTISSIVFMVILVSLYLASKMVKKIMIPLNNLCDGAQRIQEGNLDQDIFGEGVEELEKVCGTFNEMQHQLKANAKKNEKYERDRNEMLAGISHDLRTPLTSIKSYVKGLQDDIAKTPEKQKEYLGVVYRKACEIEGLINSLFLFSKFETNNFPFDFKSVSIQNFIVTLLDSVEYDLNKHQAVLMLKSTCTDQRVHIDGQQMTRAIMNILDNSVKYNAGKQIHITVHLSDQDGRIVIRIQDDGEGVSDAQLHRLFDSFYRGDESRNNASEGSGLGLAIAKNIVTANGGKISAENHNGLTIIIDLPVEKEENW